MLVRLHTTVAVLCLLIFFTNDTISAQSDVMYVIEDVEYSYTIRLENVTDQDQAKPPVALLGDFFKTRIEFDNETNELVFTCRKNKGRIDVETYLAEFDYTILNWSKTASDRPPADND